MEKTAASRAAEAGEPTTSGAEGRQNQVARAFASLDAQPLSFSLRCVSPPSYTELTQHRWTLRSPNPSAEPWEVTDGVESVRLRA